MLEVPAKSILLHAAASRQLRSLRSLQVKAEAEKLEPKEVAQA